MPDGDGTSVYVELFVVYAQTIAAIDYLHGKSFIEFPEVNVIHLHASALQQLGNGENRADSHFVRFAACYLEAAEDQLVGNAELIGALPRHQQRSRCAIRELRGV